jgi:hypothetical protein
MVCVIHLVNSDSKFRIQDSGFMSASGWFFGMPLETKIIYFVTSTFAGLA